MGAVNEHPPALWQAIRQAYEGRDPARQTTQAIKVEALADAFGVHHNSIFTRSKSRSWVRPPWYQKGRGPRAPKQTQHEMRRARLLAVLRQAASSGQPCPNEPALVEAVCVSARTARQMLTDLGREGVLTVERRENQSRRVVFPDGAATAWSNARRGAQRIPSDRPPKTKPTAPPRRKSLATPRGGIDLPVAEATRAMRRGGRHVFDTGVLHGRWREQWSVDGKIVDRAGLLREAARAV